MTSDTISDSLAKMATYERQREDRIIALECALAAAIGIAELYLDAVDPRKTGMANVRALVADWQALLHDAQP